MKKRNKKINSAMVCHCIRALCITEDILTVVTIQNYKEGILSCSCFSCSSCVMLRLPPRILKRGGLERSGQRLISLFGKTKRIAIFFQQKKSYIRHNNFRLSVCNSQGTPLKRVRLESFGRIVFF